MDETNKPLPNLAQAGIVSKMLALSLFLYIFEPIALKPMLLVAKTTTFRRLLNAQVTFPGVNYMRIDSATNIESQPIYSSKVHFRLLHSFSLSIS